MAGPTVSEYLPAHQTALACCRPSPRWACSLHLASGSTEEKTPNNNTCGSPVQKLNTIFRPFMCFEEVLGTRL